MHIDLFKCEMTCLGFAFKILNLENKKRLGRQMKQGGQNADTYLRPRDGYMRVDDMVLSILGACLTISIIEC